MTSPPHPGFGLLGQIDWDDTTSIQRGCTPLFDALASDPTLLAALVSCSGNGDDPRRLSRTPQKQVLSILNKGVFAGGEPARERRAQLIKISLKG